MILLVLYKNCLANAIMVAYNKGVKLVLVDALVVRDHKRVVASSRHCWSAGLMNVASNCRSEVDVQLA